MSKIVFYETEFNKLNFNHKEYIFLLDAAQICDEKINSVAEKYLHANEMQVLLKRKKPLAKKQFLASRIALKQLICRLKNLDYNHIWLTFNEHENKLVSLFNNTVLPYTLSVAHSHGRVLVALSQHNSIGVDIELINSNRDFTSIARQYFHANEFSKVNKEGVNSFYFLWTQKEAFAKCVFQPLSSILERNIKGLIDNMSFASATHRSFCLTAVSPTNHQEFKVNILDINQMLFIP